VNGREWLDLSETLAFDRTTIIEAILSGGSLHGFSLATEEDFEDFAFSAGIKRVERLVLPGQLGPDPAELISLVGWTVRAEGGLLGLFLLSSGEIAEGFNPDNHMPILEGMRANVTSLPGAGSLLPGQVNTGLINTHGSGGFYFEPAPGIPDDLDGDYGPFWLYRSAVPEPSSIALLVLGISIWAMRPAKRR
jgi:hypothetical protein